jgi:wyosine [tRNA(Phe)-imidazoG37] synthetase (radical SAM superfamily)
MLATVNPMDEDPQYVKAFLSKLSSAVPCFIELTSYNRGGNEIFNGRVTTRNRRQGEAFSYSVSDDRKVTSTDVTFSVPKASYQYDALSTVQSTQLEEQI